MVNIHDYKDLVLNWYDKCTASFAFVIAKKKTHSSSIFLYAFDDQRASSFSESLASPFISSSFIFLRNSTIA